MARKILFYVFLVSLVVTFYAHAGEVKLTTYYPAPYGEYKRIITKTLGVGDADGDGNVNSSDAPNPDTNSGEVWIKNNVGIGTTSPLTLLQVGGKASGNPNVGDLLGGTPKILVENGLNFFTGSSMAQGQIKHGGDSLSISNNQYYDADGGAQLFDPNSAPSYVRLDNNNASSSIVFATTNSNTIAPPERMRITKDGNVGIGTAAPGSMLDVAGTVRANGLYLHYFSPTGGGDTDGDGVIVPNDILKMINHYIGASLLTSAQFTRADVDTDGMITAFDIAAVVNYYNSGNTAPMPVQENTINVRGGIWPQIISVDVSGNTIVSKKAVFNGGIETPSSIKPAFNGGIKTGTDGVAVGADAPGYTIMMLPTGTTSDALYIGNKKISVVDSSDIRAKENIAPSSADAVSLVKKMAVVDFDWKEPEKRRAKGRATGLIAQDVDKYLPQVVDKPEDPNDMWAVEYQRVVPYLIKAIQQQQEQIENLEGELLALKRGRN